MTTQLDILQQANILLRGKTDSGGAAVDSGEHAFAQGNPLWVYEYSTFQAPFEDASLTTFEELPPHTPLDEALNRTKLIVMLGASVSPQMLQVLVRQDVVVLIVEPDESVLEAMLAKVPEHLKQRPGLIYITGNIDDHETPIQELLPRNLFDVGFPAIFATQRIREAHAQWEHDVVEYLELLYYRYRIYPVSGQQLMRSMPIRNISRGMFFDQQLHLYSNILDYLRWPTIEDIRHSMAGCTAILVAAGPALQEKIEYIRRNADKAIIISVNNALKPLLEHGIEPHFTVINDSSIASGEVFKHIKQTSRTTLVGHCLSDLGGDRFRRKFIFGSCFPDTFGARPMLRLHGSVISAAFSLARHLGCARCVFIGAQLASTDPWNLSYSKGTIRVDVGKIQERELTYRYPQLYPVQTPEGETLYTSLNFRDAALWLSEEIRTSGIQCVNTSQQSILFGKGITYDPEPEIEVNPDLPQLLAELNRARAASVDHTSVLGFLHKELANWQNLSAAVAALLEKTGPELAPAFEPVLHQLDNGGVTHLVERFDGYENRQFLELLRSNDPGQQDKGRRYYLTHVVSMANLFCETLEASLHKAQKYLG